MTLLLGESVPWFFVSNRSGRPRNSDRRDPKRSQQSNAGKRNRGPHSPGRERDKDRRPTSGGRGSNDQRRGPGVEKPERHFGDKARGARWGGVARRGAHNASIDPGGPRPPTDDVAPPPARDDDVWHRSDNKSRNPKSRRRSPGMPIPELAASQTQHLSKVERDRLVKNITNAGEHFLAERFGEGEQILRPLIKKHPRIAEIHELYGLTLYRLGRWGDALERLEYSTQLTGDIDQLPVMADCHRALGHVESVRRLWEELRLAGPEASIMTEGRIVMAGALADIGDIAGGIRLLEKGPIKTRRAQEHHVRLWYALADLYERAGDHQRARRGFERIEQVEPHYADVSNRLESLS